MNSKNVPVAHRVLPKSFCTRDKSMPKFGFQQPILGGGEEVEAQIQELGGGRGGFTTHTSQSSALGSSS